MFFILASILNSKVNIYQIEYYTMKISDQTLVYDYVTSYGFIDLFSYKSRERFFVQTQNDKEYAICLMLINFFLTGNQWRARRYKVGIESLQKIIKDVLSIFN